LSVEDKMPDSTGTAARDRDTGLESLVLLIGIHEIAADREQISHRFGGVRFGIDEMLRCAKEFGLKARSITSTWPRLAKTALPALAQRRDGSFFLLGKIAEDKVLIHDPLFGRPQVLSRAEFEAAWNGRLLLITRRANLAELTRRFDITWFLQAIHKYRRILGEVLVASLFLQIFALVTPLFFQVVVDKVLVHRGFTTLDVLVVGLIAVSIFETTPPS
jgi:subfamily B ATP-binding cassette protein HlyB/CyaB